VFVDVVVVVRSHGRAAVVSAAATVAGAWPTVVHTSAEAELALGSRARDLLIVDPDVAVFPVSSHVSERVAYPTLAWLAVRSSARAAELLEAGADDVLDVSMGEVEIAARLRRSLRRFEGPVTARPAVIGELEADARLRRACWRGEPLGLTARQIEVLQVLVARASHPVPREVIYRQVWRWTMPRGDRRST
jgi:DNA-binding response OmpR family regulator